MAVMAVLEVAGRFGGHLSALTMGFEGRSVHGMTRAVSMWSALAR
jgi:hypothetical protein